MPDVSIVLLAKGRQALIATEDAEDVGSFNWTAVPRPHTTYVGRQIRYDDGRRGTEFLHRRIAQRMGLAMERMTDHRDGNGLDCRRENLRAATNGQNTMNARRRSDNTSGIKGVHWDKREQRWKAYVGANGEQHNLGYFESPEAARVAVAAARERLHGEFANQGDR